MPGERQKIDTKFIDIDRYFAQRLRGVRVHEYTALMSQGGDLPDRLQGADFIVGVHDTNQDCAPIDCFPDRIRINAAVAIHRQNRDAAAEMPKELARLECGRVLDRAGYHVRAPRPLSKESSQLGKNKSFQRVVAGLAAAAGEKDFIGLGAEKFSYLPPGLVHGRVRCSAERVAA